MMSYHEVDFTFDEEILAEKFEECKGFVLLRDVTSLAFLPSRVYPLLFFLFSPFFFGPICNDFDFVPSLLKIDF